MYKILLFSLSITNGIGIVLKSKSEEACQKYSEKLTDRQLLKDLQLAHVLGEERILLESPHMAALGYDDKFGIQWGCSGTIISERYVLTAAHCLQLVGINKTVKYVRVGDLRLDNFSKHAQHFEAVRGIPHPEYNSPSVYNDIGLIELNEPIEFNKFVKPACLYPKTVTKEFQLTSSGWGFLEDRKENVLHRVSIKLVNLTRCSQVYQTNLKRLANGIMEDKQLCASFTGKKGGCLESGSPIQFIIPEEELYRIVGITSFGKHCTLGMRVPTGYTRVSYYIPWIESIVWF